MKRGNIFSLFLIIVFTSTLSFGFSQTENNNIAKEERKTEAFTKIKAGETFIITYVKDDNYKVIIETNPEKFNQINIEVVDQTLKLKNNSLRNPAILNIYVHAPSLEEIDLSGVAELYSAGIINTKSFIINTCGASSANLPFNAKNIYANTYGASKVNLSGVTDYLEASASGSSVLDANQLTAKNSKILGRNKAIATVNVSNELEIKSQDASKIKYTGEPLTVRRITKPYFKEDRVAETELNKSEDKYRRSSFVKFGSLNFEVGENRDSTIIRLGRNKFVVDEYGNSRFYKIRRTKFNGHWGGIDIGINAYVTPNFSMNFPSDYDYLDLKLGKSVRIDLNIFEQNIPLSKNNNWGFITGIGFELRNYRFDKNIYLDPDQNLIKGYYIEKGVEVEKHKLTANYLSIPFIFEYQTNAYNDKNSFHASLGMVLGLRIGSKTKMVFAEENITYKIYEDEDRLIEATTSPITTPNTETVKHHASYHLNPIKTDVMFRIGWGWFNLYASYSLNTLFKSDEGPELYPISFGITLVKW